MSEQETDLTEEEIEALLKKVGQRREPPEEMAMRVRSAVKTAWAEETAMQSNRRRLQIAASVVVAAGALALFQLMPSDPVAETVARVDSSLEALSIAGRGKEDWQPLNSAGLAEGSRLRASSPVSISFSNGMNVRLNANTGVTVDSSNQVSLTTGTVYLDSYDKPADVSFAVVTPHGTARDIGTQFMVSTTPVSWSIQVREGEVQMRDGDQVVQLAQGDSASIDQTDNLTRSQVSPGDASWQWTEKVRPVYVIEGKPLEEYLSWVARETGRTVSYGSDEARQMARTTRLGGSIDHLRAGESLKYVMPSTTMEVLESEENVILVDIVR